MEVLVFIGIIGTVGVVCGREVKKARENASYWRSKYIVADKKLKKQGGEW